ncbi:hypothetical protein D1871_14455 [Nakamurella silvestris]|nr:hypothetical protein D1871_14455 [Nakamurella silvestris]
MPPPISGTDRSAGGVLPEIDLPDRLRRALVLVEQLRADGIHFAPIRHHSPACSVALRAQLTDLAPAVILIEGPEEYTHLLPQLIDPGTVPPVAVLSHHREPGGRTTTGFYPLAEFSPEWVALRSGAAGGAEVAFIDLPWASASRRVDQDAESRSIQQERHLAHSTTLQALARLEHCRDHDELWDHLFELRTPAELRNWRRVFGDVFVWSALARSDYELPVLRGEGSIARESLMAARIAEHRQRSDGPVVVVTGAFHTLALIEALAGSDLGAVVREAAPQGGHPPAPVDAGSSWLIRYDFRRLDALGGYSAGMPSPGWYHRVWAGLSGTADPADPADPTVEMLVDIAHHTSRAGTSEVLGVADVSAAAAHAWRLAELRGHPAPGRTDVLDAVTSCFVKDDAGPSPALREALEAGFTGLGQGSVPAGTPAPPIIADTRRRAEDLRLNLTDSDTRHTSLDLRRNPRHRRRSRFLTAMSFLGTGFARRTAGPDLVGGTGLGLLYEEWDYAWTPMTEAELLDLAEEGSTVDEIALSRLRGLELAVDTTAARRSANHAVQVLIQAAVMGLSEHSAGLAELVRTHLQEDPSLASVISAGRRLVGLRQARDQLDLGEAAWIDDLLTRVEPVVAYLLSTLGEGSVEDDEETVDALLAVRRLDGDLAVLLRPGQERPTGSPITRELLRLRASPNAAIAGALTGLAVVDGSGTEEDLGAGLSAQLRTGADVERAVRYLTGFMKATPDLLLHSPELLSVVHRALITLPAEQFLGYLPELRRAFTWLKPRETARLAEQVTALGGIDARSDDLNVRHHELTAADLERGRRLELSLRESLAEDGLADWTGT